MRLNMKISYNTIDFTYKTVEEKTKILNKLIKAQEICPKSFVEVTDRNNKSIRVICSSKRIQIEAIVAHSSGTSVSSTKIPVFIEKMTAKDMIEVKNRILG